MNDLDQIEYLARHLMTEHGVGRMAFSFSDEIFFIARCRSRIFSWGWVPESIEFSRMYAERLTEAQIREVILHEIAHALVPGAGHDERWVAKAREIGCSGNEFMKSGVTFSREELIGAA